MSQTDSGTSSENGATLGVDTIDPKRLRAHSDARRILTITTIAFGVLHALALVTILHNNRLEHYPAVMDPSRLLMVAGAGVMILAACWFAWTRLRSPVVLATGVCGCIVAILAGVSYFGVAQSVRPLINSASYDAAVKEFGDTFTRAAELTEQERDASKLIARVANDDAAAAVDLRAAIDACNALVKRLMGDAAFLEGWPQVCRETMRGHGVSEARIEYYAQSMERMNDTSSLLESNAQLAMLLQARKLELRGRLAALERGAPTPTDAGDAGSGDK